MDDLNQDEICLCIFKLACGFQAAIVITATHFVSQCCIGLRWFLHVFALKKANIVTLWYPSVGTPKLRFRNFHMFHRQVLSRHQFLEMLLRVADQRYVQTGPA